MTSIQQSEVGREFPFGVTSRQSMELEPRSHRQSDREHEVTERYTWFSSALCFLNSDAVFFPPVHSCLTCTVCLSLWSDLSHEIAPTRIRVGSSQKKNSAQRHHCHHHCYAWLMRWQSRWMPLNPLRPLRVVSSLSRVSQGLAQSLSDVTVSPACAPLCTCGGGAFLS